MQFHVCWFSSFRRVHHEWVASTPGPSSNTQKSTTSDDGTGLNSTAVAVTDPVEITASVRLPISISWPGRWNSGQKNQNAANNTPSGQHSTALIALRVLARIE
jgi:hypothetical protein